MHTQSHLKSAGFINIYSVWLFLCRIDECQVASVYQGFIHICVGLVLCTL